MTTRPPPLDTTPPPIEPPDPAPTGDLGARADATISVDPRWHSEPGAKVTVDILAPEVGAPWTRYEDLGLIGRGGMAEVRRVRDRVLGRELAMKILPLEAEITSAARARLLAEARLSAGLQHPGIVPVHDCGASADGRLWFVMKEVRGQTLRGAIRAAHRGEGSSSFTLRRLVEMLLRVCEAVAYAHRVGVIHQDLKPDNVMIGDLGEVLVVDWGLARALVERGAEASSAARATAVLGTPAYMSPEQARGQTDRLGPWSDVYALGAILYEILCGAPPYRGLARAVLALVVHGPPEPVGSRVARALPDELVAACERAMARAPEQRFPDASALAEEMRSFLDGARKHDRALTLLREAEALAPHMAVLQAKARALRAAAASILGHLPTHAPAEQKAPGWALEDQARALEVTVEVAQVAWQTKLHSALAEAPDLAEAHAALADHHAAELRAAEAARDPAAAARAEALLAQHDRGRHAVMLGGGGGAVSLVTDPEGAEVWVSRYVERSRQLLEEPLGLLGRTPLRATALPPGSYLLRVRAPGRAEMRYPVHLGRAGRWDGIRPGDTERSVIPLLPEDALGPDELYIPAGPFLAGGDPAAGESLPAQTVWVDGFILGRHPITVAEYLAFLDDLVQEGRGAEAEAACPCIPRSVAGDAKILVFPRGRDGRFRLPDPADDGALRRPVVSITWHAATAYAAWWSNRTGHAFRLPSEIEREKAARGVDGRFFPWGDQEEPTWACMAGSHAGAPGLAAVDEYPIDESPCGGRGLAGNVRDWCVEAWRPAGPPIENGVLQVAPAPAADPSLRAIRGGAYFGPSQLCRAAVRFAARPEEHGAGIGLRLARPAPRRIPTRA